MSNDKFMDHRVCMKAETLNRFQRWLSQHQLMVHWYDRTRMKLVYEVGGAALLAREEGIPSTEQSSEIREEKISNMIS